jgi:hypothetical protein
MPRLSATQNLAPMASYGAVTTNNAKVAARSAAAHYGRREKYQRAAGYNRRLIPSRRPFCAWLKHLDEWIRHAGSMPSSISAWRDASLRRKSPPCEPSGTCSRAFPIATVVCHLKKRGSHRHSLSRPHSLAARTGSRPAPDSRALKHTPSRCCPPMCVVTPDSIGQVVSAIRIL